MIGIFDGTEENYATSQKVAGLSPNEVTDYFFSIYLIVPAASWLWGLLSL
jgi:hypothetical protein